MFLAHLVFPPTLCTPHSFFFLHWDRGESRKSGNPRGNIWGGSDPAQFKQQNWTRSPTHRAAVPQRPGTLSVHMAKLREEQRDDEGSVGERPLSAASPLDSQALQRAVPESQRRFSESLLGGSLRFPNRSFHSIAAHYRAASGWSSRVSPKGQRAPSLPLACSQ